VTQAADSLTSVPNQGSTQIRVFLAQIVQTGSSSGPGALQPVNTEGTIEIDPNTLQPVLLMTAEQADAIVRLLSQIDKKLSLFLENL
jgi:hypothetical protein